jgi:hypothetical protein
MDHPEAPRLQKALTYALQSGRMSGLIVWHLSKGPQSQTLETICVTPSLLIMESRYSMGDVSMDVMSMLVAPGS